MNIFKENKITLLHAYNQIFRIYLLKCINKEKEVYESLVMISGLFYFKCEISINDIEVLIKHFDFDGVYLDNMLSESSLNSTCQLIDTGNKLPISQLVYLFYTRNSTNLSLFYNKLINHEEYLKEKTFEDKQFFIINQIYLNRESLMNAWVKIINPVNNWLFSNASSYGAYSRMDVIKDYIPSMKEIDGIISEEYEACASFEELYFLITSKKKVVFEKELKKYILDNLFYKQGNITIINIMLFERIRTLFDMNGQDIKSLTEMLVYVNIMNKIEIEKYDAFLSKEIDLRRTLFKFCHMFKEKPLVVLKKTNIPFHLIKKKILLLEEYYKNNEKLSIEREKKLYYFLSHLSKKLSSKVDNFLLKNENNGFNSMTLNNDIGMVTIKTVKDFNQLYEIGVRLNNCAGNFEQMDYYNKSYNFIIKDNKKEFLGNIVNGELDQLKGYKNESPSLDTFVLVNDFLIKNNYIKEDTELDIQLQYNKKCVHTIYID